MTVILFIHIGKSENEIAIWIATPRHTTTRWDIYRFGRVAGCPRVGDACVCAYTSYRIYISVLCWESINRRSKSVKLSKTIKSVNRIGIAIENGCGMLWDDDAGCVTTNGYRIASDGGGSDLRWWWTPRGEGSFGAVCADLERDSSLPDAVRLGVLDVRRGKSVSKVLRVLHELHHVSG